MHWLSFGGGSRPSSPHSATVKRTGADHADPDLSMALCPPARPPPPRPSCPPTSLALALRLPVQSVRDGMSTNHPQSNPRNLWRRSVSSRNLHQTPNLPRAYPPLLASRGRSAKSGEDQRIASMCRQGPFTRPSCPRAQCTVTSG